MKAIINEDFFPPCFIFLKAPSGDNVFNAHWKLGKMHCVNTQDTGNIGLRTQVNSFVDVLYSVAGVYYMRSNTSSAPNNGSLVHSQLAAEYRANYHPKRLQRLSHAFPLRG
ncbi:hypothetical protein FKM82_010113 [Ascaphus truei]